ncbi:conserved hypothetical protein [Ricinus communis]|uniref:Uncharacterized protein n=1 Tax=Ricinus communis TaxID=3988 RepID=B9T6W2_RICCO|nr:conserved hypothetical protein [Ricinus communis]
MLTRRASRHVIIDMYSGLKFRLPHQLKIARKCNGTEANKRFMPSYFWSGVLEARWVFERELRWKVGSGETVQICKDAWVPGFITGKVAGWYLIIF